jgi:tRNA(Ile)-lysidine synthase
VGRAFGAATLRAALESLGAAAPDARYCVALSGGADSTALLNCLVELRRQEPAFALRAIHVNHHLQSAAGSWAEHCAALGRQLSVPLMVLDAQVRQAPGESPEAAARDARYGLLAEHLSPGEFLLTAHHAEDQLETFLLQLARGAGVAGLASMPRHAPLGQGIHLRPLLEFSRDALRAYLTAVGLGWIDDPSNAELRFDRNYLRQRVLPILLQRWPSLAASSVRSAEHLASAQRVLDEVAKADYAPAAEGRRLQAAVLRGLEPARLHNALRYWIRQQAATLPPSATLEEIAEQMLGARDDAIPQVTWGDYAVRRYRDRLYLDRRLPAAPSETLLWRWRAEPELTLPAGLGTLRARAAGRKTATFRRLPEELRVNWRSGGERLRVAVNRPHRELRALLQEWDILPWMRAYIPLLYAADTLVAVGDLAIAAEFRAAPDEPGTLIEWLDHPALD